MPVSFQPFGQAMTTYAPLDPRTGMRYQVRYVQPEVIYPGHMLWDSGQSSMQLAVAPARRAPVAFVPPMGFVAPAQQSAAPTAAFAQQASPTYSGVVGPPTPAGTPAPTPLTQSPTYSGVVGPPTPAGTPAPTPLTQTAGVRLSPEQLSEGGRYYISPQGGRMGYNMQAPRPRMSPLPPRAGTYNPYDYLNNRSVPSYSGGSQRLPSYGIPAQRGEAQVGPPTPAGTPAPTPLIAPSGGQQRGGNTVGIGGFMQRQIDAINNGRYSPSYWGGAGMATPASAPGYGRQNSQTNTSRYSTQTQPMRIF